MFELGLYEQLINKLFSFKLSTLDKEEAAQYLSRYLSSVIQTALNALPKENSIEPPWR